MSVYADDSIPANLRKTPAEGFSQVDSVADCDARFRVRDGATVREMTDAEKAKYYPQEIVSDADRAKAELAARDADGADIRILEDVIDALVAKTNVQLSDLPEAAKIKLAERKALRATINGGA